MVHHCEKRKTAGFFGAFGVGGCGTAQSWAVVGSNKSATRKRVSSTAPLRQYSFSSGIVVAQVY